jgi:AcrR family transcriptional regulator
MAQSIVDKKKLAVTPERRAQLVDRVIPVLEELLAEDGVTYPELSVEKLIRATGISRATFYIYFEDKAALLNTIADRIILQLVEQSATLWSLPMVSARADLYRSMRPAIDTFRQHAVLIQAISDTAGSDDRVRERLRSLVASASEALASAIEAGQDRGDMRAEVDAHATAPWLMWMAERGLTQLFIGNPDEAAIDRAIHALAHVVWSVLYRETGTA